MVESAPLRKGDQENASHRAEPRKAVEIPRWVEEAIAPSSSNGAGAGLPLFLQFSPELLQKRGWGDFLSNPDDLYLGIPEETGVGSETEELESETVLSQTEETTSDLPDPDDLKDLEESTEDNSDLLQPSLPEPVSQEAPVEPAVDVTVADLTAETAESEEIEAEIVELDRFEESDDRAAAASLEAEVAVPESESDISVASGEETSEMPSERQINPDAVVRSWQRSVSQAAQGIPQPTLTAGAEAASVEQAGTLASEAQQGIQQQVPGEALNSIPAPPQMEQPPPAPATDPIPEQTSRIREIIASRPRLPEQTLPALQRSPLYALQDGRQGGGSLPRLGDRPIDTRLYQLIITPGALELSGIQLESRVEPEGSGSEQQLLQNALERLQAPLEPEAQAGTGQPAPLVDQGPQPIPPLPEAQRTPVGQVIARLLSNPDAATADVVRRLRQMAYPNGILQQQYPDIEAGLTAQLQPDLISELREVADAAGVSGEELDRMVADHHQTLQQEAQDTQTTIQQTGEAATEAVSEAGQDTLDAIAGARLNSDEAILQRQEAASGGTDPEVINARRDLVIRWVRQQVTSQITQYQNAQERREGELTQGERQQQDAYTATAQRDEYQILHGPIPALPSGVNPTTDEARTQAEQRRKQDLAAEVRNWQRERTESVQREVRRLLRQASESTQQHRSTMETAGNEAIAAARIWAEDRILEGSSWWERLVAQLTRWFGDAQNNVEQWEVRRTQQTRDGIVQDLNEVARLQERIAQGATREELLAREGLTAEQRAIVEAHFEQLTDRHPLDLAAVGLRQRLASNHRAQAVSAFERELVAKPYEDFDKLNEIGRAMRPGFEAAPIARQIHTALDQWGTDEAAVYAHLQGLNTIQAAAVRKTYRVNYNRDLDAHLRSELSGEELTRAQLQLSGRQSTADAVALHDAVAGLGTNEEAIMTLLRGRSQAEIEAIQAEYLARYGESLEDALRDDLSAGNEQDQADALMRGDTATADAIALDEAMRDSFFSWGTDEARIEQTYQQVRSEVQALAEREGWNSEQMEAEIRRRSQAIEAQFNRRYASVEQYQVPGMEGRSVLRQAFASEMNSGPERDLANALADNDLATADAARIEIERRSVYADDEAINRVLRSQYERSLQATRLDQGPARRRAIDRQMQQLQQADPSLNEEELSRRRIALEHQMEADLADAAQARSRVSMEALQNAYDDRYGRSLSYALAMNMSGTELERARALVAQGGRLTPLQEVEFATRDVGTDEDALRRTFSTMTRAEIAALRRDWEARHPGESFDAMLRGELSGRDQSDVMDMVEHGAPESASERIAQQRRRTEYELNELTGVLGGLAASSEEAWLRRQLADLEELEPQLYRTNLTPEERLHLRDQIDMRVTRVEDAIADHRRAIDSVTDTATQVVGLAVGLTVGTALTVLSGGALGPVMVAVLASVASTVSTMGTKYLIQGGSYGVEDMGVDLAVGVVDALTAAATAGMGSRLLGSSVARQAARPTQATRLASRLGQSALAQRIGQLPGVQGIRSGLSSLNRLESGVLTRGISGQGFLARMAQGDRQSMRLFAELIAEGIENAASAVPSAVVGTALNDQTWRGNAALNLLEGTFMGVGTGVLMGGAIQGGGHLYHGARRSIRLSTPEGRFLEASQILGTAFQQHRNQHPSATYADFMAHPDGIRARADVERQGLISTSVLPEPTAPRAAAEAPSHPTEPASPTRPAAESSSRPDTTPVRPDTAPPSPTPADRLLPAPTELRNGLPQGMRDTVPLHIDPDLTGRTVQVKPDIDPNTGLVRGVRILAGAEARPIDILMHAPVVQGMQRYSGLLGRVRVLLERVHTWFHLEDAIQVGSPAWEARLELQKLPAILEQRMHQLSDANLSPGDRARLLADVEGLSRQIDTYQATLDSPAARQGRGRGYVAAEETLPPPGADTAVSTRREPVTRQQVEAQEESLASLMQQRRDILSESSRLENQAHNLEVGRLEPLLELHEQTQARFDALPPDRQRSTYGERLRQQLESQQSQIARFEDDIARLHRAADEARARVQSDVNALDSRIRSETDALQSMQRRLRGSFENHMNNALRDYPRGSPQSYAPFEQQIRAKGLQPGEEAVLRSYSRSIQELCDLQRHLASQRGQAFDEPSYLQGLLREVQQGHLATAYESFRLKVREDIVNSVRSLPDRAAQIQWIGRFTERMPDPGAAGHLFGAFRETYLLQNPEIGIRPVTRGQRSAEVTGTARPLSEGGVGQRRSADGVVEVGQPIGAGTSREIPPGRYAAEDKAGGSSDYKQALDYHRMLNQSEPQSTVRTPRDLAADGGEGRVSQFRVGGNPTAAGFRVGGRTCEGIIFFHQSRGTAQSLVDFLNSCQPPLDARIRVAYFNERGNLVFLR